MIWGGRLGGQELVELRHRGLDIRPGLLGLSAKRHGLRARKYLSRWDTYFATFFSLLPNPNILAVRT